MTITELLSGFVSAEKFDEAAVFTYTSKAEIDKAITHLAASAVKITLDAVKAGKNPDSREVNVLLYHANVYKEAEARLLRTFIENFGPFVIRKEPAQVLRKGAPPLVVPYSLKWSQKKYDEHFKERSSISVANEINAVSFATWKKAKKQEDKTYGKSSDQLQQEKAESLQKRLQKLLKEAEENDITLAGVPKSDVVIRKAEEPTEKIVEKIVRKDVSTIKDLFVTVTNLAHKPNLTEEEKAFVQSIIDLTMKFINKSVEKAA